MPTNPVVLFSSDGSTHPQGMNDVLKRACLACFEAENVPLPCYVSLSICTDGEIRLVNRDTRGIDAVTDVLSFPTISYVQGETARRAKPKLLREWEPEYGACFLGDILISLERAQAQAIEYHHSCSRELSYLFVHGVCHLMGYDHINGKDREAMRKLEEKALSAAGAARTTDNELLDRARQAMLKAYVPYSKFRVGAAVMTADGSVYTGCNVENASYGLTNCAERTAIFKAVSEGHTDFEAIAIASEKAPPWPCGACRQVMSEFAQDMRVLVTWEGGSDGSTLQTLLPHNFSPSGGIQRFLGGDQ